ncbi:hypothetical protein RRG08_063429 [Elysia crispata]|uniref:Uncharacterized protein n=1 Tax=Elysia crispata TaxID=231223 RepID=A0AAE1DV05_9GAST|nr:hypothetical protein RRG08_063429 [Elysia crispata]
MERPPADGTAHTHTAELRTDRQTDNTDLVSKVHCSRMTHRAKVNHSSAVRTGANFFFGFIFAQAHLKTVHTACAVGSARSLAAQGRFALVFDAQNKKQGGRNANLPYMILDKAKSPLFPEKRFSQSPTLVETVLTGIAYSMRTEGSLQTFRPAMFGAMGVSEAHHLPSSTLPEADRLLVLAAAEQAPDKDTVE